MRYYFIYRKYKYVNLLTLNFNNQLQLYKDTKKLNDHILNFNKNFVVDYELEIGQVDLEFNGIKKIGSSLYANLENDGVIKALNFHQKIEVIK